MQWPKRLVVFCLVLVSANAVNGPGHSVMEPPQDGGISRRDTGAPRPADKKKPFYPHTFQHTTQRPRFRNMPYNLTLGFSGGGRRSMALTVYFLNMLDEVQRWDPVSRTYNGKVGSATWLYDSVEGVSGGSWGIAAYNNGKDVADWFGVNKDMCIFKLLKRVYPACGALFAGLGVMPECHRFPIFKSQEKPAYFNKKDTLFKKIVTKTKYLNPAYPLYAAGGAIFKAAAAAADVRTCLVGLKDGSTKWFPIWSQWVRNYAGKWNKNGRLKRKDVRFFFSSFDNDTPNYKDWTQIMWASPTLNNGLSTVGPLSTYNYYPKRGSFVKGIDTWLAVGSAAMSVDLGKFGMGVPLNIFLPVKDDGHSEVVHEDRRAKAYGHSETFFAHKLTHLGDAGFLLNNPIRVEDPDVLGGRNKKSKPTIRVMIDAGADEDYGAEEMRRTVNYIRRFGRKDIRITNVCKGTVPCPEVSPVHLLEMKNGLIIHLKANSPYFAERTMMMFPTAVMYWTPEEELYFRQIMHEWAQKVAKFVTSLRSDLFAPEFGKDGYLTPKARKRLLRQLEELDDLRVLEEVSVVRALDGELPKGTRGVMEGMMHEFGHNA